MLLAADKPPCQQASSVEVKHAYKTLARKLHPDKLGAAADPTPFHQLVQAYEGTVLPRQPLTGPTHTPPHAHHTTVLSNPVSRDLYDAAACVWLTAERYVNEYRDLSLTVSGLGLRNSSLPPQQQDPPHTTAQGLLTAA